MAGASFLHGFPGPTGRLSANDGEIPFGTLRETGAAMRLRFPAALLLALLVAVSTSPTGQASPLRILQASPSGATRQLADSNEIRVVFSEAMVALGRVPANPTPAWIHIAPAMKGAFRWSGTTILIFRPDPATPLPYATRYTVTVDRTAESAEGHALGASFQFTFTTPTVTLMSSQWMRQTSRYDSPVALALTFNQPVRAADVLAHAQVRFESHDWDTPVFPAADRARLEATDPDGLRRFDTKV